MKVMTEVKERVSMENILEHYEVEGLIRKEEELVGECPLCKQNGFKANITKQCWNCFGCKSHGNILDFVAMKELVTVTRAAQLIHKWFPKKPETVSNKEEPSEVSKKENKPIDIHLKLDPSKTPFNEETAQYFEAGYCSKGIMRGRVAIPLLNGADELIGYVGKKDDEEDKYPNGFYPELVVYNLHHITGNHAYLCWDYYDVWKLHEEGKEAIAIPNGHLTLIQMLAIREKVKAVTLLSRIENDTLHELSTHVFVRLTS